MAKVRQTVHQRETEYMQKAQKAMSDIETKQVMAVMMAARPRPRPLPQPRWQR